MKSISTFHAMSHEKLSSLSTRLLLCILDGTRPIAICPCGDPGCQEGLEAPQYAFNASQYQLAERAKALLATRSHIQPKATPPRKAEKKQSRMVY